MPKNMLKKKAEDTATTEQNTPKTEYVTKEDFQKLQDLVLQVAEMIKPKENVSESNPEYSKSEATDDGYVPRKGALPLPEEHREIIDEILGTGYRAEFFSNNESPYAIVDIIIPKEKSTASRIFWELNHSNPFADRRRIILEEGLETLRSRLQLIKKDLERGSTLSSDKE